MRIKTPYLLVIPLTLALACSEPDEASQPSDMGTASGDAANASDAASADATAADTGSDQGAMVAPYVVEKTLVSTTELGTRREYRVARGIIHAHSVHSHDACDGQPEIDGVPNEPCLDDFRTAICQTRQDYVFLTDHEELAARKDFDTLLMLRDEDEAIRENGIAVGNQMRCPDGFRPLLLPGGEFGTMPVGMTRHLPGTVEERETAYEEVTPERVQALKDLGAVVLQAHAESRDRDTLRSLGLDGFEVYQLHANVAPDIRREHLGLDDDWVLGARPFIRSEAVPDLVFLSFFAANQPSLDHFDALVAEGQKLVGTGGTDCHQNVLNIDLGDGERLDSYRRMMRWFSNHLLVEDMTPTQLKDALRAGRLYIAFEIFGTPDGFDYRAEAGGAVAEIGDAVPLSESPRLHLEAPEVHGWGPVPVTLKILKIEADGAVVVASGEESLMFEPEEAGAYRAVVEITPTHLRDALGPDAGEFADQTYEWIWANPIYVE